MAYLIGVVYLHEFDLEWFARMNGKTEDQIIEDMVYLNWSLGRDENGWLEFWEPYDESK